MQELNKEQAEQVTGAVLKCPIKRPPVTTLALGEEGGGRVTTLAVGEEDRLTTLAIGEEDGGLPVSTTGGALGAF